MQATPRTGHLAMRVLNGSFRLNRDAFKITAVIPMGSGTRTASASPDMQRIMMSQPNMAAIAIGGAPHEAKAAFTAQGALGDVQQQLTGFWNTPTIVPKMFHEQLSDPEVQDEATALGKVILLVFPLIGIPLMYMRHDRLNQLEAVIEFNEVEQKRIKAQILASKNTIMDLTSKIEYFELNPPVQVTHEIVADSSLSEGAFDVDMSMQGSTAESVLDAKESTHMACTTYAVGASVEVFSNSFNAWCPGKVMHIESSNEQTLLTLEFTWPTGELARKTLAQEHQDVRIAVQGSTAQRVSDAEESVQSEGANYAVGASVEVFSNSFNAWCLGKVIDIESSNEQTLLTLEFTWPTGEVATKQLAQGDQDLRAQASI